MGYQQHEFDNIFILDDYIYLLEDEPIFWTLYFDDLKCIHGVELGRVLVSLINQVIPIAYKLDFKCIHNMAKYEALILVLKAALKLKIIDLEIYRDSHLIINQVKGCYDIKDEKLKPYRVVMIELLDGLDSNTIETILRTNNRYVDTMASISSLVPIELKYE